MLKIKASCLTEKGVLKPEARNLIREGLGVQVMLRNGTVETLTNMGGSTYYGKVAEDQDGRPIWAKVTVAITMNEYREPTPKEPAPKAPKEPIQFE